jgi:hypothetical protein
LRARAHQRGASVDAIRHADGKRRAYTPAAALTDAERVSVAIGADGVQLAQVTQDDTMRLCSERPKRWVAAGIGFRRKGRTILLVDIIHVAEIGGVEVVPGQRFEVVQFLLELWIQRVGKLDAGRCGYGLQLIADELMIVRLGRALVLDVLCVPSFGSKLAGLDLKHATLAYHGDEGPVGGGGRIGGACGGRQHADGEGGGKEG